VRVSGPFTVESLSPHRVLRAEEERPASEKEAAPEGDGDYVARIPEYLRKSGVQNTVKQERLTVDRLEPYAGKLIVDAGQGIVAWSVIAAAALNAALFVLWTVRIRAGWVKLAADEYAKRLLETATTLDVPPATPTMIVT
jgi:C4-dicarboxylate-specific signal transduction histidine kinase